MLLCNSQKEQYLKAEDKTLQAQLATPRRWPQEENFLS